MSDELPRSDIPQTGPLSDGSLSAALSTIAGVLPSSYEQVSAETRRNRQYQMKERPNAEARRHRTYRNHGTTVMRTGDQILPSYRALCTALNEACKTLDASTGLDSEGSRVESAGTFGPNEAAHVLALVGEASDTYRGIFDASHQPSLNQPQIRPLLVGLQQCLRRSRNTDDLNNTQGVPITEGDIDSLRTLKDALINTSSEHTLSKTNNETAKRELSDRIALAAQVARDRFKAVQAGMSSVSNAPLGDLQSQPDFAPLLTAINGAIRGLSALTMRSSDKQPDQLKARSCVAAIRTACERKAALDKVIDLLVQYDNDNYERGLMDYASGSDEEGSVSEDGQSSQHDKDVEMGELVVTGAPASSIPAKHWQDVLLFKNSSDPIGMCWEDWKYELDSAVQAAEHARSWIAELAKVSGWLGEPSANVLSAQGEGASGPSETSGVTGASADGANADGAGLAATFATMNLEGAGPGSSA